MGAAYASLAHARICLDEVLTRFKQPLEQIDKHFSIIPSNPTFSRGPKNSKTLDEVLTATTR